MSRIWSRQRYVRAATVVAVVPATALGAAAVLALGHGGKHAPSGSRGGNPLSRRPRCRRDPPCDPPGRRRPRRPARRPVARVTTHRPAVPPAPDVQRRSGTSTHTSTLARSSRAVRPQETPSRISASTGWTTIQSARPRVTRRPIGELNAPRRTAGQWLQHARRRSGPTSRTDRPRWPAGRRRTGSPCRRPLAAHRSTPPRRCSCRNRTGRPPPRAALGPAAARVRAATGRRHRPQPARGRVVADPPRPAAQASTERRPENARPRVTSSAYSRSPPTGSPLASRVTDRSGKVRSNRLR